MNEPIIADNKPTPANLKAGAAATADRFDLGVTKLPAFVIAKQLDINVTAKATLQS